MKKTAKKAKKENQPLSTTRTKRMTIMLSDKEQRIIDSHLSKYKIKNKSRWARETILAFIYRKIEEDYPTLFSENEMRR